MGALDDRDLAAEIALLGEVMAAVTAAAQELSDAEVDEVLGVAPAGTATGRQLGDARPVRPGRGRVAHGHFGRRGGAGGG